jgi:CBS domain-containing protein
MKVHEIMTAHARCVGPENTLVEAAGLMRELDVGALPVCENDRIAGIVTDRDMVLRGTADGRDPNTTMVRDVMSAEVVHVFADQEVEEAVTIMEERQIRRLPVVNREKRLVGIVSLGDVATSSSPAFSGMALRDVSQPSAPNARQRRLSQQSEPAQMPEVPGERKRPASRGGNRGASRSETRSGAQRKSARSARTSRSGASTNTRQRKSGRRASAAKSSGRSGTKSRRPAGRAAK